MKSRTQLLFVAVMLIGTVAVAQDANERAYMAPTFQDPAVPMIQLPTDFKAQRVNTEVYLQAQGEGAKPGRGLLQKGDLGGDWGRRGEIGSSIDILNVKGPGAVRHIWQLIPFGPDVEIEICVDGAKVPQVRMPAKPFYGIMHDLKPYFINSAGFVSLPNPTPPYPDHEGYPGYSCYMPIPFSTSCRITLHAMKDQTAPVGPVSTMINWHQYKEATPITPFRFHAQHNLEKPAVPHKGFQMLETEGRGFVAGLFMGVRKKEPGDFVCHTGGMRILIDGETDPHANRGMNMEDDYGFTWGFNDRQTPWIGCPYSENRGTIDQDGVFYRFFGPDPIAFHSSISFLTGCREDDTESVLYYYRILGSKAPKVNTPKQWQITDPFPGSDSWDGFNQSEFVENTPSGSWPEVLKNGDQSVRVHSFESKYTWADLNRYYYQFGGGFLADHSVYARTTIDSDHNRAAVLRLALDDWAFVWLNGEKIATLRHEKGLKTVRIPIELKQGKNELRIKNTQTWNINRGLWAISCVVEEEVPAQ